MRDGLARRVGLVVLLAVHGEPAFAATARTHVAMTLDIDGCVPASEQAAIRRIVAVELAAARRKSGASPVWVTITCEGQGMRGVAADVETGAALERFVALQEDMSRGRNRLVALAIVELAQTLLFDRSVAPEEAVSDVAAAPETEPVVELLTPPPVTSPPAVHALSALAVWQRFAGGLGLWGGGVGYTRDFGGRLRWAVDLCGGYSHVSARLGDVRAEALSIGAWVDLIAAGGGLGARGGVARLAGTPEDDTATRGRTLIGPWGGPAARLFLTTPLGPSWRLEAAITGGVNVFELRGLVSGGSAVAVSRTFVTVQLAVGSSL